jgi:hypothetical protein
LYYYLAQSDIEVDFDLSLHISDCVHLINNVRVKLKDVVANVCGNTRFHNCVIGEPTWKAINTFLSKMRSSIDKTEGLPNDHGKNWDIKLGDT